MTVLRHAERRHWTVVDNAALDDPRLSLRDRGLLVTMLRKPDGWKFSSDRLAKELRDGRDAILASMKVLAECGYLRTTSLRGDSGKFTKVTDVSETSVPEWVKPDSPTPEKPDSVPPGQTTITPGQTESGSALFGEARDRASTDEASTERTATAEDESSSSPSEPTEEDPDNARTITSGFYDWVVARDGHPPALDWNAIHARVKKAQKAKFNRKQIKAGLVELHERGMTITDTTLRNAITGKLGARPRNGGGRTDDDWGPEAIARHHEALAEAIAGQRKAAAEEQRAWDAEHPAEPA